jgi:hypothetical protein
MKEISSVQTIMKPTAILQLITWLSVCLCSVAAEPTNTPVRVTISQFSRPPEDRIIVTSTNVIARLEKLFPGYGGQPADGFARGHWPVDFTVGIAFADGHSRVIYVADNRWTAGDEHYTALAQNWDEVLGSLTTNFFKRTWPNMERLSQVHERTTLIIGPYESAKSRGGDMKGQPATNRTSAAVGSGR